MSTTFPSSGWHITGTLTFPESPGYGGTRIWVDRDVWPSATRREALQAALFGAASENQINPRGAYWDHALHTTPMEIGLQVADSAWAQWAQRTVTLSHYLASPVDSRCSPFVYLVVGGDQVLGCLIFGRPEATRCYDGALTYGSVTDVDLGRAKLTRWEVLNLARVWLHPDLQPGGPLYSADILPGYIDRRGVFRSTLASSLIAQALERVNFEYLAAHPPCFPDEPYAIQAVLSYCDRRRHKGTIYRAAGFELARTNKEQIETWCSFDVAPLSGEQDYLIRGLAAQSQRSRRYRSQRAVAETQEVWNL